MKKNIKIVGVVAVVLLVIFGLYSLNNKSVPVGEKTPIRIGVITALTGDVAYWGQATKIGADLAQRDLVKEGIEVEFIFEDAQLDPKMALNSAQKLVNVDHVDAIFSEFNPAAIAAGSFLKDKNILHVYNASPVSPLKDSPNTYKTFTDYQTGCRGSAEYLKSKGITKVGVLKINLEFGQQCLDGVKSVYGDQAFVETFNPDTTDFRTMLAKLKSHDVQAVFNASFSPDQITTLKNMKDLNLDLIFMGTTDIMTPEIVQKNGGLFTKTFVFGLPNVSKDFIDRIMTEFPGRKITNEQAAGLAYVHLKQMDKVLAACGDNLDCVRDGMDNLDSDSIIGFRGFKNHIADFDLVLREFKDGQFVTIQN